MKTSTAVRVGLGIFLCILAVTVALYARLPDQIPIHWNLRGEIDGWGDKRWAAFLLPGTCGMLVAFLIALPTISRRGFRVDTFHTTFNYLMVICAGLMSALQLIVLQSALHPGSDFSRMLYAVILLFLASIGNVLGRTRRNFFIGMRTPWTLANESVWIATHRLAGRLFVLVGILGALAVLFGAPLKIIGILLLTAVCVPVVYSYLLYQNLDPRDR